MQRPFENDRLNPRSARAPVAVAERPVAERLEARWLYASDGLFTASINFQPAKSTVVTGYSMDHGALFGDNAAGLAFGWTVNETKHARSRNLKYNANPRYDTFVSVKAGQGWKLSVPDGTYEVHLALGDPAMPSGLHVVNVEGESVKYTASKSRRWGEWTLDVSVTDGILLISAPTGVRHFRSDSLDFVDVTQIAGSPAPTPTPTPTPTPVPTPTPTPVPTASLSVQNLDIFPGNDRMIFNRIQTEPPAAELNPSTGKTAQPPVNIVHDTGTVRLTNTGTAPLLVTGMEVNGPWTVLTPTTLTVAPGSFSDVSIQFVATSEPTHSYNQTNGTSNTNSGGTWSGSLTLNTNDHANANYVEQLAGWWQDQSENSMEPSLQSIINLLANYTTVINSAPVPVMTEPANKPQYYGQEVQSYYWQAADPTQAVGVHALASYHVQGNTSTVNWTSKGSTSGSAIFTIDTAAGQTLLPTLANQPGVSAQGTFSPGSAVFGFKIDQEFSDDTLNSSGGHGHHIRFFPVYDSTGALVPNSYFMCLDYSTGAESSGENFDFQDIVDVVSNVVPAGN